MATVTRHSPEEYARLKELATVREQWFEAQDELLKETIKWGPQETEYSQAYKDAIEPFMRKSERLRYRYEFLLPEPKDAFYRTDHSSKLTAEDRIRLGL